MERGLDDRLDPIDVFKNLVVPEPEDLEPFRLEPLGSLCVGRRLFRMLPAIQFDDELCLETNEIGNVFPDRRLLSKTESVDPLAAQPFPQPLFRLSAVLPEPFGLLRRHEGRPPSLTLPHKGGGNDFSSVVPVNYTYLPRLPGEGRVRGIKFLRSLKFPPPP